MSFQLLEAFPTPIYRGVADGILPILGDIEKRIDALRDADVQNAAGTDLAEVFKWQQYTSFFSNQHLHRLEWFKPIEDEIMRHLAQLSNALELDLGARKFRIETAFANIMSQPFHQHGRHVHHGAVFSGVVYIRAGSGTGQITFEHPARDHFMHDLKYRTQTMLNTPTISISPNSGEIVIFPSHTPHQVEQSFSQDKRVAISFNAGLVDA